MLVAVSSWSTTSVNIKFFSRALKRRSSHSQLLASKQFSAARIELKIVYSPSTKTLMNYRTVFKRLSKIHFKTDVGHSWLIRKVQFGTVIRNFLGPGKWPKTVNAIPDDVHWLNQLNLPWFDVPHDKCGSVIEGDPFGTGTSGLLEIRNIIKCPLTEFFSNKRLYMWLSMNKIKITAFVHV